MAGPGAAGEGFGRSPPLPTTAVGTGAAGTSSGRVPERCLTGGNGGDGVGGDVEDAEGASSRLDSSSSGEVQIIVHFHSGGLVASSVIYSLSDRYFGMLTLARIFLDSPAMKTYRFICRISVLGSLLIFIAE